MAFKRPSSDHCGELSAAQGSLAALLRGVGGGLAGDPQPDIEPGAVPLPLAAGNGTAGSADGDPGAWAGGVVAVAVYCGQRGPHVGGGAERGAHEHAELRGDGAADADAVPFGAFRRREECDGFCRPAVWAEAGGVGGLLDGRKPGAEAGGRAWGFATGAAGRGGCIAGAGPGAFGGCFAPAGQPAVRAAISSGVAKTVPPEGDAVSALL